MKYRIKYGRDNNGIPPSCCAIAECDGQTIKGWGSTYPQAKADLKAKLRLIEQLDNDEVPPDEEIEV